MASKGSAFQLGLSIGAASAGAVLLMVYTAAAPTHDLRARLPYLMSSISTGLLVALLGVFGIPGVLVLALSRRATWDSIAGVLTSSVACLLVLGSGLPARLLPDFTGVMGRVFATLAVCTLSALSIARGLKRARMLSHNSHTNSASGGAVP
jgi:hypothetical protein